MNPLSPEAQIALEQKLSEYTNKNSKEELSTIIAQAIAELSTTIYTQGFIDGNNYQLWKDS